MQLILDADLTPHDRRMMAEGAGFYHSPVRMPDGGIACAYRLMYHWALLSGLNDCGYDDRWCYGTELEVLLALLSWSGEADTEPEGWHKHPATNRCRPDLTPASESIGWPKQTGETCEVPHRHLV